MDDLKRLGVNLVPAVTVGDRIAHGWNPDAYAKLLGIDYTASPKLSPTELAERLDRILETIERLVRAVPDDQILFIPAERKRTVGQLAYHAFRLSIAFADAMDRGEMPEGWLQEQAPTDMLNSVAIASYGALVRARLRGWFEATPESDYGRIVAVYYGPQSGHALLERTTWHAGQHLRQLYDLADRLHVKPPAPLPVELFAGLPLPAASPTVIAAGHWRAKPGCPCPMVTQGQRPV